MLHKAYISTKLWQLVSSKFMQGTEEILITTADEHRNSLIPGFR